MKHPYTGVVMTPRLLGETEGTRPRAPGPGRDKAAGDDRLLRLADWVSSQANPFFARAQANRIWSHLLGRGIVDPDDDFRQTNPPANGPLLEALAADFSRHGFNQKRLIRTIMDSRIYQLSAQSNETNFADETNCSHTLIRSLPAEALLDAIAQATGTSLTFDGYPEVKRAGQLPSMPVLRRRQSYQGNFRFLRTFGKPERLLSCACERSDSSTLAQALQLITGEVVNKALTQKDNRLGKLLQAGKANSDIIEDLYLASLCRYPTDTERSSLVQHVERSAVRRDALEDVLWGLLNSKEFLLRK